jgi:hypothetical protein
MEFKINKRTRIKILSSKLEEIRSSMFPEHEYFYEFRMAFQAETGLARTSTKDTYTHNAMYYFKVVDKHKYFLAKIKYGF